MQWPAECRAAEADEPLLVAQAGTTEGEAASDGESTEADEELADQYAEEGAGEEVEDQPAEEAANEELADEYLEEAADEELDDQYAEEVAYDEELEEDEEADGEVEPDYSGVEEIVVTGRAGDLLEMDAAQSAVEFDAAALEALGAADVSDIAKVTPNLEITMAGATTANFFIRGVGLADYSANSASAVAIYQDGVPLNSAAMQLVGLFDVSALQVLRGPQGTGSGRNASAGAITIDSRMPTGGYEAQLRVSLGTYLSDDARKALIQDYEGALELPIVEDLLSTRLSFRLQSADPYMTNGCGGEVEPGSLNCSGLEGLPKAVGDKGNWAARGLFRLQPDALDMDWILNLHGGRLDQQSTLGQAMGTSPSLGRATAVDTRLGRSYYEPDQLEEFRRTAGLPQEQRLAILAKSLATGRPLDIQPYRGDYNRVGQTTRDSWGGSLTGNLSFDDVGFLGPAEILTITAYDGYQRFRDTDNDFTPIVLFERIQNDEAWQLFQELKATGERDDGVFRWELGGYYLMENLRSDLDQKTLRATFDFLRDFEQDLQSFAFYAGFSWDFLDDFTLDVGGRYNWERKRFDFSNKQGEAPRVFAETQESTWSAPTGLIGLKYRFNDEVAAYWKYSRGWKGGHYNANRMNSPPAEPETLDSVEAGFRGSWFDARLDLSGSIFYYKYKNYQVFLFEPAVASPPILEVINANDAEQYGVELDLNLRPLRDWTWIPELWGDLDVTVRFGWLQSQFLDFVNLIERQFSQAIYLEEVNYTGNQLPNAPKYKLSLGVEWPLDFGRYGTVTPHYTYFWTDDIFFDPSEGGRGTPNVLGAVKPEFTVGQPAYGLHNLRLAYRSPDGTFEIAGWVRNLTDERYKSFAFDASIFAAVVINFVGEPRTVGVDVSFSF